MAFLQLGDNETTADGRRLQDSSRMTKNALAFSIDIRVVPLEEYVQLVDTIDSSAPTNRVTTFITTTTLVVLLATLSSLFLL